MSDTAFFAPIERDEPGPHITSDVHQHPDGRVTLTIDDEETELTLTVADWKLPALIEALKDATTQLRKLRP